jgi:hypothetical protein
VLLFWGWLEHLRIFIRRRIRGTNGFEDVTEHHAIFGFSPSPGNNNQTGPPSSHYASAETRLKNFSYGTSTSEIHASFCPYGCFISMVARNERFETSIADQPAVLAFLRRSLAAWRKAFAEASDAGKMSRRITALAQ